MASTANSYAALLGTSTKDTSHLEQELGKKKKKRNNKKNKKTNNNDNVQNEEERQYEGEGEFQMKTVEDVEGLPSEGVGVAEACRLLERQARDESLQQRQYLLQEWTGACQASGDEFSSGQVYAVTPEGQELTFRQVLIRSRALEFLIEYLILHFPYRQEEADETHRLIQAAFPAESQALIDSLMHTVQRLNNYGRSQQVSGDVRNATTKAMNLVMQSLKGTADKAQGGQDMSSLDWQRQVSVFDNRIATIYPHYDQLQQSASGEKVKELVDVTKDLMDVCLEKFNVIMSVKDTSGITPSIEVVPGTYEALDAVYALTDKHMKTAQAQAKAQSTSAKKEQIMVSFQQQQQQLDQQTMEVTNKIQSLQDEIAALKSQLQDIENNKVELISRRKAAIDALNSGQKSVPSGMSVETCKGYEEVVQILKNCVKQAEAATITMQSQNDVDNPVTQTEAPKQYLASIQYYVKALSSQMSEVTRRVEWALEKLSRAIQLQQQLKQLGEKDKQESQIKEIQKMINSILTDVQTYVRLAGEAEEKAKSKGPMLRVLPGFEVYRGQISKIEQTAAQIRMKEQYIQEKIKNAQSSLDHKQKPAKKKFTLENILAEQEREEEAKKQARSRSKEAAAPPPAPVSAPTPPPELIQPQMVESQYADNVVHMQPVQHAQHVQNVPQPQPVPIQQQADTMQDRYERLQQQLMMIQSEMQNLGSTMGGSAPPMNGGAHIPPQPQPPQPQQNFAQPPQQSTLVQDAHVGHVENAQQYMQQEPQYSPPIQPPSQNMPSNGRAVGGPVKSTPTPSHAPAPAQTYTPAPPPGSTGAPSWKTVAQRK